MVVERDVGADHLWQFAAGAIRFSPQSHVAEQLVGELARQLEPLPAEGQVSDRLVGSDGSAGRPHHLEATVQNEGVDLQLAALVSLGQGHLAQCLAGSGPECPQRSECGAEIDPDLGFGAVVGREFDGRQVGLQPCRVERHASRWRADAGARSLALGM